MTRVQLPPMMGARHGAFGMLVVNVIPPATPHLLLPLQRHDEMQLSEFIRHALGADGAPERVLRQAMTAVDSQATPELQPEELRLEKEQSARQTMQPWGWIGTAFGGQRIYMSVTGPRWVCCGNRFDEGHSPWCSAGAYDDPLPPA